MKHASALMALGLIAFTGCGGKGPRNLGVIIDSVGKHPVKGQYVSYLEIKENDAGNLRLWFGIANRPASSSIDVDLLEGWFVYGESQARFWVFDGEARLNLLEYSGSPGDEKLSNLGYSPDEIPNQVLPRLPASREPNEVIE